MNRRQLIKLGAAGWVLLNAPYYANATTAPTKKIIWLVLRGAMDSLHAVVPVNDPYLMQHRAALIKPIQDSLLPLNQQFSLHPELKNLHQWYQQQQMAPVVAVASPYRARSHFDAQDILESGLNTTDHNNGWLARALAAYQEKHKSEAIAIARSTPISLRGQSTIRTVYPSVLPEAEPDLYQRLEQLYQNDPLLSARLQEGMEARNMLSMTGKPSKKPKFSQLAKMCGELLSQRADASCAMLEMGGWDTHNAQVNRLNRQFSLLDNGLGILKEQLGKEWANTVIIIATEFGRTVAVNGTQGTDHGTASALLVAGGGVAGGRVLGQWPGLAPAQLHQQRDLKPTSDIRYWLGGLIQQHWHLSDAQLASIFPDTVITKQPLIIS